MDSIITLEDFYRTRYNFIPDNLRQGFGHFNVFNIDDSMCNQRKPSVYSRKEYFKISLLCGKYRVWSNGTAVETEGYTLLFRTPGAPYTWEPLENNQGGYFCIFTNEFFNTFPHLTDYPVFKNGNSLFSLNEEQGKTMKQSFEQMFVELASHFSYKYDAIRHIIFDMVISALRMQPVSPDTDKHSNAAERLSTSFIALLERQFPIETTSQHILLKSPHDFAEELAVHVNHLNRSLKETTGKNTSQMICERLLQEAQALLRQTKWNVSEIGFTLGFDDPSHFINFFKKHSKESPKSYRARMIV